jgi:hypothetical protein
MWQKRGIELKLLRDIVTQLETVNGHTDTQTSALQSMRARSALKEIILFQSFVQLNPRFTV